MSQEESNHQELPSLKELSSLKTRSFSTAEMASRWFQLAIAALHGGASEREAVERANAVSDAYEESYGALKKRMDAEEKRIEMDEAAEAARRRDEEARARLTPPKKKY